MTEMGNDASSDNKSILEKTFLIVYRYFSTNSKPDVHVNNRITWIETSLQM